MNNFPFKHPETGETMWYSRSVAVVGLYSYFDRENETLNVLAVKRGTEGDEPGKWSLPCGYLDFDETIEQAVVRELKEETGIFTESNLWEVREIDSNPKSNRQNVSIIFKYNPIFSEPKKEYDKLVKEAQLKRHFFPENEGNEIAEVEWITIPFIYKMSSLTHELDFDWKFLDSREWAFNHNEIIKKHY